MTSLRDLGPLIEQVDIRGKNLSVHALGSSHIFYLLTKYPQVAKIIDSGQKISVNSDTLMNFAPGVLSTVIAAVTEPPLPDNYEQWIKNVEESKSFAALLSAPEQLEIVQKAFSMTFPSGDVVPFVTLLRKTLNSMETAKEKVVQETQQLGSEKASPPSFNAELQKDFPGMKPGTRLHVN